MRVIFMGSPEFAVPSLEALAASSHALVAVYSQPPRPAGRGKGERKTAVHDRAEALGIEVRTPRSLRDEEKQAKFAALGADIAIVAAYGLILPRAILDAPRLGCVNVHASLLPRWRGAAPIHRAIMAGDEVTGVTIMQMEDGLDTGPMLLKRDTRIDHKTAGELTQELARLGADALLQWLAHPTPPQAQPEVGVTYASKVDKAEARIDWNRTAEEIERQVRAFNPAPGAWFEIGGERVKLLDAECVDGAGSPGEVIGGPLVVACGEDAIHCRTLQRAGKGAMAVDDFLRGFPVAEGTMLA
ncbi:MAG TPA: methionyl-tRNA formyltransferase [Sphingomicrobium sp.]|nr:methionyl-tRNA formyltransferase [Sphingomicrobium sp.]